MVALPNVTGTRTRPLRPARQSLLRYWLLYRERAHLAALDADALKDIGIGAADARSEARRAPWGAPDHWTR